jgi:hypothetical protein
LPGGSRGLGDVYKRQIRNKESGRTRQESESWGLNIFGV